MSATTTAVAGMPRTHRSTSLYQLVWKWHFFAALYVLPFMALLSVTGALHLFDNSIEEVLYKDRLNVVSQNQQLSYSAQAEAVLELDEGLRIRSVVSPLNDGRAS